MEKEIIESWAASVPLSNLGEVQANEEIWEEQDGGAHFKLTRHRLPLPSKQEVIGMSISGDPLDRKRVIQDFKAVLGPIENGDISLKDPHHVDVIVWLVTTQ